MGPPDSCFYYRATNFSYALLHGSACESTHRTCFEDTSSAAGYLAYAACLATTGAFAYNP